MNIKKSIKKHRQFSEENFLRLRDYLKNGRGFAKHVNLLLNVILKGKNNSNETKKSTTLNSWIDYCNDEPKSFCIPIFSKVKVSIIIPVYNNFHITKRCVWSIAKNTGNVPYEIIIADDCSNDETKKIESIIKNVKRIKTESNGGFLLNCNNAAKKANGEYLVFLNNDTVVQKGWLEPLLDLIESDSEIGLVGSQLIYPDGTLQEAGGIVYRDANAANYGNGQDPQNIEFNYVKEVDYISGASILLSKETWESLGGFDERYIPAYYEDTDLSFMIRYKLNLKVKYQPLSKVVHFEGRSNGVNLTQGIKRYQLINKNKFYEKWKAELNKFHAIDGNQNFLARDHSFLRKTILVIDWKVLSFTKDAGSRASYHYLHYFKKLGFNVKFWAHEMYEEEDYLKRFLQDGFEVLSASKNGPFVHWIREYGSFIDFVYLNRPNVSKHYIDSIRRYTKAKVIYQGHDLEYLRNFRIRKNNGDANAEKLLEIEKNEELTLIQKMDTVCFFSNFEVDLLKQKNSFIDYKQVPLFIYDSEKYNNYNACERKNILFVGGFRHYPNVEAIHWFVKEVFPLITAKLPKVSLYIVGSHPPESVIKMKSDNIIVTGYVSDNELDKIYNEARLAVVPLLSGAGVKGKVIEAIYNKIPVVTTSVGAEGIINNEDFLTLADDPDSFAKAVVTLYSDFKTLNSKSKLSIQFINDNFSERAANRVFEHILNG